MISILIVDDSPLKIRYIKDVLIKIPSISEEEITVVNDRNSAKQALLEFQFDLMVLDINLPERFGDQPNEQGGVDFLKEINMDEEFLVPFHIIGLTEYPDLLHEHGAAFSNYLWHLVVYNESYSEWKDQLTNFTKYLVKSQAELKAPSNNPYDYDLAVVTVLSLELKYVRELPWNWTEEKFKNDDNFYYTGYFFKGKRKIKVVATSTNNSMGMCAAAAISMKVINRYRPKYISMVGICAGIEGKVNIGDPIIADRVWDYGSGKHVIEKNDSNGTQVFKPYINQLPLETSLMTAFTKVIEDDLFVAEIQKKSQKKNYPMLNAKMGPFASGSAVIANESIVESIKSQHGQLVGFDMESYSIFYSATHSIKPKPIPFMIKSISDFGDSNKNNPHKDEHQAYAAFTSANFFCEFASNYIDFDN
ncbi:response regulator [Pedobacter sp. G11]|uniref:phosphorylase family protein n=1 Tax=Pedobacter sp. G11 TaxID=2482728 RepID=UPI000F5D77AC|nr:response regulator [Pedobacter sp. G11]AZI26674.1 response regulator [Pedobacter sp. G11]